MENKESMVIYESTYKTMELILNDDASWREAMTGLLNFGFYGDEPHSDNPLVQAVYVSSIPSMRNARERWEKAVENGKKGGRPTEVPIEDILIMKSEGMTNKEIAEQIGCTVKNIEKRITTYNKAYPTNPTNPSVSVSVSEYVSESDSVSDSAYEYDYASVDEGEGRGEKKREIEDLSYGESRELTQELAQGKARYSDLMQKYNLKYIDKEKLRLHLENVSREQRQKQETESAIREHRPLDFELYDVEPQYKAPTRRALDDIVDDCVVDKITTINDADAPKGKNDDNVFSIEDAKLKAKSVCTLRKYTDDAFFEELYKAIEDKADGLLKATISLEKLQEVTYETMDNWI